MPSIVEREDIYGGCISLLALLTNNSADVKRKCSP